MSNTTHAGHGGAGSPNRPMDPGATGNGTTEHGEMLSINSAIVTATKWVDTTDKSGSTVNNNLYNITNNVNRVAKASDTNISNHMNAFNRSATGVEVWYYAGDSKGYQLASKLSAAIAGALGITNRGAKATTDLYVVRETVGTTVLVEWCFIDNANDMAKWRANKNKALEAALAVLGYKPATTKPAAPACKINYGQSKPGGGLWLNAHVSNKGWTKFVGSEVAAGSIGCNLALEAIDVRWNGSHDYIESSFRDLKGNWTTVKKGITGTTGKNQPMDLVCFSENEEIKKSGRVLQYRVHSQDVGWGPWKDGGRGAGTKGKKIEAIEMRMLIGGKVERG